MKGYKYAKSALSILPDPKPASIRRPSIAPNFQPAAIETPAEREEPAQAETTLEPQDVPVESIVEAIEPEKVEPTRENPGDREPEHRELQFVPTLSPSLEVSEPAFSVDGTNDPQSKPEEPTASTVEPVPVVESTGKENVVAPVEGKGKGKVVEDDTLTASRGSGEKVPSIPIPLPLERVEAIITPQEELAMKALPESLFKPVGILPPKVYADIVAGSQGVGGGIDILPAKIPYPGTYGERVDMYDMANIGGEVAAHAPVTERPLAVGWAPAYAPAPVIEVDVPAVPLMGNVEVDVVKDASVHPPMEVTATAPMDTTARFLKPAGIATAGIVGIGALISVVWLADKVKGFISRRRNKKVSAKKARRHVRDWSVTN